MCRCVYCINCETKGGDAYCKLNKKQINKERLAYNFTFKPLFPCYMPRWCPKKEKQL